MNSPASFLTPTLLNEIAAEFEWPLPFMIEDANPDGVTMEFRDCGLIFSDGGDGGVIVRFFVGHTKTNYSLHIGHAMAVYIPENERINGKIPWLNAIPIINPFPSIENTTDSIRNACKILTQFLTPVMLGDFTWVDEYRKMFPETRC